MARRAMGWILILFTLALVGCDHATKAVARSALERRGALTLVPGLLDLRYAENRDTAFSLLRSFPFAGKEALLVALALAGLAAVLIAWWRHRRSGPMQQTAYALLAAGAIGNALDRLLRGYVVDFIEIHHWPVFNVADVAVVAGAALLGLSMLRRSRRDPDPAGGPA